MKFVARRANAPGFKMLHTASSLLLLVVRHLSSCCKGKQNIDSFLGAVQALDQRPVRTQVVTTGVLWAMGDVTAQKISKSKVTNKDLVGSSALPALS